MGFVALPCLVSLPAAFCHQIPALHSTGSSCPGPQSPINSTKGTGAHSLPLQAQSHALPPDPSPGIPLPSLEDTGGSSKWLTEGTTAVSTLCPWSWKGACVQACGHFGVSKCPSFLPLPFQWQQLFHLPAQTRHPLPPSPRQRERHCKVQRAPQQGTPKELPH